LCRYKHPLRDEVQYPYFEYTRSHPWPQIAGFPKTSSIRSTVLPFFKESNKIQTFRYPLAFKNGENTDIWLISRYNSEMIKNLK